MEELANALRSEVERAAARLRLWSEEEAGRDRGPGKWVAKEILGHLCDSAANNHQRFVRARFADPFAGPGYDQVEWVRAQRYRERSWLELVELWVALNRHVAAAIETVPDDRLATSCRIGSHEPAPLEWWMTDYLRHVRHHLGQLERR
jgi:hypothetical protein